MLREITGLVHEFVETALNKAALISADIRALIRAKFETGSGEVSWIDIRKNQSKFDRLVDDELEQSFPHTCNWCKWFRDPQGSQQQKQQRNVGRGESKD